MISSSDPKVQPTADPNAFTFRENVLTRCFVGVFFGLAALIVAVAGFLKLKDGPVWIIPALAASGLALALFYYVFQSLRTRQTVTVTSQSLTSHSPAAGDTTLTWAELTDIREVQSRLEKARSVAPLFEVMLSLYFNLPFLADGERRALLVFEAGSGRRIAIRQHLLFPHRLDELRLAINRHAPPRYQRDQGLRANTNN